MMITTTPNIPGTISYGLRSAVSLLYDYMHHLCDSVSQLSQLPTQAMVAAAAGRRALTPRHRHRRRCLPSPRLYLFQPSLHPPPCTRRLAVVATTVAVVAATEH